MPRGCAPSLQLSNTTLELARGRRARHTVTESIGLPILTLNEFFEGVEYDS